MSHLPPEDSISLDDMVKFAKFQLCLKNKVLMKDPIWDDYTREEIMAEFYAHQFSFSEKAKLEFEASIKLNESGLDDFAQWADKQMANEKDLVGDSLGSAEERVEFDPKEIMGE